MNYESLDFANCLEPGKYRIEFLLKNDATEVVICTIEHQYPLSYLALQYSKDFYALKCVKSVRRIG